MRVKVRILGMPEVSATEHEVSAQGATLADLRGQVVRMFPDALTPDDLLLGFVNGKAAQGRWEDVALNDGDAVMFVVPISGG